MVEQHFRLFPDERSLDQRWHDKIHHMVVSDWMHQRAMPSNLDVTLVEAIQAAGARPIVFEGDAYLDPLTAAAFWRAVQDTSLEAAWVTTDTLMDWGSRSFEGERAYRQWVRDHNNVSFVVIDNLSLRLSSEAFEILFSWVTRNRVPFLFGASYPFRDMLAKLSKPLRAELDRQPIHLVRAGVLPGAMTIV